MTDDARFPSRVALVTGAGQGIGRGISLALAEVGVAVAVVGRTEAKLVETCAFVGERGGTAIPIRCDVRHPEEIEACLQTVLSEFGRLDILINNAQTYPHGYLLDVTEDAAQDAWASGPMASWRFMKLAYPHLRDGGVIINMSSSTTLMHDGAFYGMYSAVKAAIGALTRTAAVEWGVDGIRALTIMPASSSPGVDVMRRERPERYQEMLSRIPLGRFGDPEADIGRAIAWLAGPDAGYITGTTIVIDGGQMHIR